MKPTVIIGASDSPERYSYKAAHMLKKYGHKIYPYGLFAGKVAEEEILLHKNIPEQVDTITLYVNPRNQLSWYDFIVASKPKRVIFNPGTENDELESVLDEAGIAYEHSCTLVMLSTGQY